MEKFYNEALEWVKPAEEYTEAKKKKDVEPDMDADDMGGDMDDMGGASDDGKGKGKSKKDKDDMGGASGDADDEYLKKACALLKKVAKKADDKTKEEIEDFLASC